MGEKVNIPVNQKGFRKAVAPIYLGNDSIDLFFAIVGCIVEIVQRLNCSMLRLTGIDYAQEGILLRCSLAGCALFEGVFSFFTASLTSKFGSTAGFAFGSIHYAAASF